MNHLDLLASSSIQAWLSQSNCALPVPDRSESVRWAEGWWAGLTNDVTPLPFSNDFAPERLHALVQVADRDAAANPAHLILVYEMVQATEWGTDLFSERETLLCDMAYCVWRQLRRTGRYSESREWEARVVALVLRQPAVAEFIQLLEVEMSQELRTIFLRAPAVLLAVGTKLDQLVNRAPSLGLAIAHAIRRLLLDSDIESIQQEDRRYFTGYMELVIAIASKHRGEYQDSLVWLKESENGLRRTPGCELLLAKARLVRSAIAYHVRSYVDCLVDMGGLKDFFVQAGSQDLAARCSLLEGVSLKELDRDAEALAILSEIVFSTSSQVEPWLRGHAMVAIAEVRAKLGDHVGSAEALAQSWTILKESPHPMPLEYFYGVWAQLQRDRGFLQAAIYSYRLSVSTCARADMRAMEAYMRILLAETLIGAGREEEAVAEVMRTLPVIDKLGLVGEAVAAIALLRESLKRQMADIDALNALRRELDTLCKGRNL